jgi:hypothetical protein
MISSDCGLAGPGALLAWSSFMTLGLRRLLTFFLVLWFTLFLGGFAAMGKHADAAGPRGGASSR